MHARHKTSHPVLFAIALGSYLAIPSWATSESEYINSSPELRELTAEIKRNPRDARAYFHRAMLWDRFFEYEQSAKDCARSIALKPSVNAYLLRAKMLASSGKNKEALSANQAAVRLEPKSFAALIDLAHMQTSMADYTGAKASYDKLLLIHPNNVQRTSRAEVCLKLKQAQLALNDLKIVAVTDKNAICQGFLGDAYMQLKQYENAIKAYTLAISRCGPREDLRNQWLVARAAAYDKTGQAKLANNDRAASKKSTSSWFEEAPFRTTK